MPVHLDYFRTTVSLHRLAHEFVKQLFNLPRPSQNPPPYPSSASLAWLA
jgi:hypothetical protein